MTAVALTALQQEVVYGSSWLSTSTLETCSAFQSLYENESCCSSAALTKEFVVFERPDASCDVGWRAVAMGGVTRCLKLHATAVWTKSEANAACVSEGAELVQPKTADDNTLIQGIVDGLDSASVSWLYFWIGLEQSPTATDPGAGWSWDDGTPVTNFGWHVGQPTVYAGATDDGPEDCVLYRKGNGWYDFGCSPSARVVCMVPFFSFGGTGMCWGVAAGVYDEPSPAVKSGGNDVCLKLLDDGAYNVDLARTACGEFNGQLYYPTTASESDSFSAWVYSQTGADAKVWVNLEQDATATDPAADWKTPMNTYFPQAEIPWGVSDPEPSEPAWPSQDFINVLVTATGGKFQDVTRMTTGSGALCVKDAPA